MALTGESDGEPLASPARLALAMDGWAAALADRTAISGTRVEISGAELLAERAAFAKLRRRGSSSAGGHCRLLPAADGWLALSLARADDVELLPAWLGSTAAADGSWSTVADLVATRSRDDLLEGAGLLGIPCAGLGEVDASRVPLVHDLALAAGAAVQPLVGARVVDLSSLWAGPLCAHLLGLAGARVVKVEGRSRPDGARLGPAAFYELLHGGHESVVLDLGRAPGRDALLRLLTGADIVIEASRPRALAALGCAPEDAIAAGFDGVWVSITAFGRTGDAATRVGFGDDAAVGGGLVAWTAGRPVFVADAVADPATGLLAALSAADALARGWRGVTAVSLAATAAHLAATIASGEPVRRVPPDVRVTPPRARTPTARAAEPGADTEAVLASW